MSTNDKLGDNTYLVPIFTISNPLCVYKNYGGRDHEFFCVLPQRKWSGFFSVQIGINNDSNLEETASIDDLGDSSSINSDDHSFNYGIVGSTGVLDFGDSCLEGAGEYCISLGFWWHIPFPEAVIQRTLKHKKR